MSSQQPFPSLINTNAALRSAHNSLAFGRCFVWTSIYALTGANEAVLYLKNDDDRNLLIDLISCGSQQPAIFEVFIVTGTPAGAPSIQGRNLFVASSNTALATAHGNGAVTGLSTDGRLGQVRTSLLGSIPIPVDNTLIIPKGKAIAVFCNAASGSIDCMVRGFFD